MKKLVAVLIILNICLLASSGIFVYLFLHERQNPAVPQPVATGAAIPEAKSGAKVDPVSSTAQSSQQDLSQKTAKATQDMQTALQSTAIAANAAAEQATRDFKTALQGALETASRELEKYNEALKKSQGQKNTP